MWSLTDILNMMGGRSCPPSACISPLWAWNNGSNAGRSAYGPSSPYPVNEQYTKSGLTFESVS